MADWKKLQPYVDCYLDKQPCTEQAATYKRAYSNNDESLAEVSLLFESYIEKLS